MKYSCAICGKRHGVYFGTNSDASIHLLELKAKSPDRVREVDGLHMVDKKKVIIPAKLSIRTEFSEDFVYQTWVELDINVFISYCDNFQNEVGGSIVGRLFDDLIPFFLATRNLECLVVYRKGMSSDEHPDIHITESSELKQLQESGMSKSTVKQLMSRIHHGEDQQSISR